MVLGRHVCRTKLLPKNFLNRYENWFEKPEKKRSETCLNLFQPLSGRLKIFHRHFTTHFKSFSPLKICKNNKTFFFHREALLCRGGHAKPPYSTPASPAIAPGFLDLPSTSVPFPSGLKGHTAHHSHQASQGRRDIKTPNAL